MWWSFIQEWFFPVCAFAVVGGQLLWSVAALVMVFRQPRNNSAAPGRDLAGSGQVPPTEEEERQALIGTWLVTNKAQYFARWTFHSDGSVTSDYIKEKPDDQPGYEVKHNHGTWKFEEEYVRVTLDAIDPETQDHYWRRVSRPVRRTGVYFGAPKYPHTWTAIRLHATQFPPS